MTPPRGRKAAMRRDLEELQGLVDDMRLEMTISPTAALRRWPQVEQLMEVLAGPRGPAKRACLVEAVEYVHEQSERETLLRVLCRQRLDLALTATERAVLRRTGKHQSAAQQALAGMIGDQETCGRVAAILAEVSTLGRNPDRLHLHRLLGAAGDGVDAKSPARRAQRVWSAAYGISRTFASAAESVRWWFLREFVEHTDSARSTDDAEILAAVEACREGRPSARKVAGKWELLAKLCGSFGLGYVAPDTLRKQCVGRIDGGKCRSKEPSQN